MECDICYFAAICVWFAVLSYIDVRSHTIPNAALAVLFFMKVLYLFCGRAASSWPDALTGLLLAALPTLVAARFTDQIGAGDLKLCAVTGFCVGLRRLPDAFLLSAAAVSLFVLAVDKYRHTNLPFAPFAAIGVCGALARALLF